LDFSVQLPAQLLDLLGISSATNFGCLKS